MNRTAIIAPIAALLGIVLLFVGLGGHAQSQGPNALCGTNHDALSAEEGELIQLIQGWRDGNADVAPSIPLQASGPLNRAAAWFAQWQVENGVPGGHTDTFQRSWTQRVLDCGYDPFWYIGSGEAVTAAQHSSSRTDISPGDALTRLSYPGSGLWITNGPGRTPVSCIGVAVYRSPDGRAISWVAVLAIYDAGQPCPEAQGAPPSPGGTVTPSPTATSTPTATATPTPTSTPLPSFGASLTLIPGQWNLVTLPAGQLESVLARAAGCYDAVYQMDGGVWRRYSPGAPAYARNLVVSQGGAFWIRASSKDCGTISL